jgi:hypothetical protein
VDILNEIARLKQALANAVDPVHQQELRRTIVERQTRLAIMLERRRPGEK